MAEQTGTANGGTTQGGGAGTTVQITTAQGDGGTAPKGASTASERREGSRSLVERLVAQWGTEARALDVLAQENYEHREALRVLKDESARLTANQIPAGGVVLTGPEKDAWDKIKAAGVPVDKVADTVKEAITLKADKVKADRDAARKATATAAKLDGDVLAPLLDQFNLEVEVRTETVAGPNNTIVDGQVAYVRSSTDAKAAWEKLSDNIAKDGSPLKPFAIALKAKGSSTTQNGGTNGTTTGSQGGTSHIIPDTTGDTHGSTGGDDPISKRLKARDAQNAARPNPLMPRTPAATT